MGNDETGCGEKILCVNGDLLSKLYLSASFPKESCYRPDWLSQVPECRAMSIEQIAVPIIVRNVQGRLTKKRFISLYVPWRVVLLGACKRLLEKKGRVLTAAEPWLQLSFTSFVR